MVKRSKQKQDANISPQKSKWERWGPISAWVNLILIACVAILGIFNHQANQRMLAFNIPPKISIKYEYTGRDSSFIELKHAGPSDLEDYWIEEKIYLVGDTFVYECPDAPRFQYFQYDGSLTSMGTLKAGEEKLVTLPSCWYEFLSKIQSKFGGRLISRYIIKGSSYNSPEYRQQILFEIDLQNFNYVPIEEIYAPDNIRSAINTYITKGPKSEIRWETPERGYTLNPPKWYTSPVSFEGDKITYKKVSYLSPDPFTVELQPHQYVRLEWSCDSVTEISLDIKTNEVDD